MKVLFLVRDKEHPATRYRVTQYLDYLNHNDVQTEVAIFPRTFFEWWALTGRTGDFDVIFIQKKRVTPFWLKRLGQRSKLIYDFDDAVMFNSSRHDSSDSPIRMRHFVNTLRCVDGVIAGNSYLKSLADLHHSRVWVLPTSIDTERYPLMDRLLERSELQPTILGSKPLCSNCRSTERSNTGQVTLGWVGGAKSLGFLKSLQPVLDRIYERYHTPVLKIVCSEFFEPVKMPIIKKPWSEPGEVADIMTFDIGLAPLPDDPWSRGKCATKLLQCMAAAVPSIASPVGVHNEIIKDGVNGFLARDDDDWFAKLSRLIENAQPPSPFGLCFPLRRDHGEAHLLRKEMGLAGRKTVEAGYSISANAPKLLEILKEVVK